MALKIFVSHAAADEKLASALVDCLLSSMVLDDNEIRCTSVPGHRLPVGCDFAETLLADLENTAVVVGLVTRRSVESSWVLFELGATWGARKALRPLVTDQVNLRALPGALSGRHVARLSSISDITDFLEQLTATTQSKARSHAKVEKAASDLLHAHASHVAELTSESLRGGAEPWQEALPETQVVVLRALAANNEVETSAVAQMAHVGTQVAAYHLEELRRKDYLSVVRYDGVSSMGIAATSGWSLAHAGREYLIKNSLIQ